MKTTEISGNKLHENKNKNYGFNLKPPYKPNELLKVDLGKLGKQKSGSNIIEDFDSSKEDAQKKKNIDPEEISIMISKPIYFLIMFTINSNLVNVDISQSDHRTDQGETDLDRDESKSAFEEESRRFNGEYFNIFTQNNFANENHKEETSSEEDYKPDFEVIEEEIHNTEEREDCKSSDIYSNKNSNSSNKKRTSIVPIHKFPTELEENPYLYYANKAKQKKIKNKTSMRVKENSQKFKVDS